MLTNLRIRPQRLAPDVGRRTAWTVIYNVAAAHVVSHPLPSLRHPYSTPPAIRLTLCTLYPPKERVCRAEHI